LDKGKHGVRAGNFRWCDGCNDFHGFLFVCRYFSNDTKKVIEKDAKEFKKAMAKQKEKKR